MKKKETLSSKLHHPRLYGWDDGKIYFLDDSGRERCVTEMPDLLRELEAACARRFAKTTLAPVDEGVGAASAPLTAAPVITAPPQRKAPDIVIDQECPLDLIVLSDEKGLVLEVWYKISPADTVPKALRPLDKGRKSPSGPGGLRCDRRGERGGNPAGVHCPHLLRGFPPVPEGRMGFIFRTPTFPPSSVLSRSRRR